MSVCWKYGRRQKLKYLSYTMESNIYHIATDGWCICGCGYVSITPDDLHLSHVLTGYCNNGIKAIPDNKYRCVCGKILDDSEAGKKHSHSGMCVKNAERYILFRCTICDVECHTKRGLDTHTKTQRHLNKVDDPLLCKICNVKCTSDLKYKSHLKTKKHIARLESPPIALECTLCNIKCLSQAQMKKHLETKKHTKNESTKSDIERV